MDLDCKLRCCVVGHEQDVRAVTALPYPDGSFVSGSRDVTSRVWVPDEYVDDRDTKLNNIFVLLIVTARSLARAVLGVVILSVRLSHAWILTKLNDTLQIFWYHIVHNSHIQCSTVLLC